MTEDGYVKDCPECDGLGFVEETCHECDGEGVTGWQFKIEVECEGCEGFGSYYMDCEDCGATGELQED